MSLSGISKLTIDDTLLILEQKSPEYHHCFKQIFALDENYKNIYPLSDYLNNILTDGVDKWFEKLPNVYISTCSLARPKTALLYLLKHERVSAEFEKEFLEELVELITKYWKKNKDSISQKRKTIKANSDNINALDKKSSINNDSIESSNSICLIDIQREEFEEEITNLKETITESERNYTENIEKLEEEKKEFKKHIEKLEEEKKEFKEEKKEFKEERKEFKEHKKTFKEQINNLEEQIKTIFSVNRIYI